MIFITSESFGNFISLISAQNTIIEKFWASLVENKCVTNFVENCVRK